MEFVKVTVLSIIVAATYGVCNNMVTAHLCIEFFCLFDRDIQTSSPVVIATTHGILSTWSVGLITGVFFGASARIGHMPKLTAVDLIRPLIVLSSFIALLSTVLGFAGYFSAEAFMDKEGLVEGFECIPAEKQRMAFVVNSIHLGGYGGGFFGGLLLCIYILSRRFKSSREPEKEKYSTPLEYDVFLSHNSEDKEDVRNVKEALRDGGVRTWLDEEQLPLGLPWREEIEKHILNVKCALVFIGEKGLGNVQEQEIRQLNEQLVRRGCPVIPVILPSGGDVEIPGDLRELTWIDLRSDYERNIRRLIGEIRAGN